MGEIDIDQDEKRHCGMNKKMRNLYKDSENGKKVIELFNPNIENT